MSTVLGELARQGAELLFREDPFLYQLLEREYQRQNETLDMVAASGIASPCVLACAGTATTNVTTEGYPGARFHAGCEVVDQIELLAIDRAKRAFGSRYANVQPHSGTSANQIVMFALLKPGETILGMDLSCGGHLTHGSKVSVSGQYFNAVGYRVNGDGWIDYDQVASLAKEHRPRLIICGASAYPRIVDFLRFRAIANNVGAYLLADISHVAGLVVAGEHPSPINHTHFTTTSTYKQLLGPRGGLILMGDDYLSEAPDGKRTLAEMIDRAVFPFFQGTPNLSAIAAKARALDIVGGPAYRAVARRTIACARALAAAFRDRGYRVLTGGTDNHIVLFDVGACGVTGIIAERALEECGIIVNRNKIPGDNKPAEVASGIRLGTNILALRGMGEKEMRACADLIQCVLSSVMVLNDHSYQLNRTVQEAGRKQVRDLCWRFPLSPAGLETLDRTNA